VEKNRKINLRGEGTSIRHQRVTASAYAKR